MTAQVELSICGNIFVKAKKITFLLDSRLIVSNVFSLFFFFNNLFYGLIVSQIGEQVVVLSRHPGGNIMTSYKSSVSSGCVAAPLAPPSGEDAQYAYPRR